MATVAELDALIARTLAAVRDAAPGDRPWLAAQAQDLAAQRERLAAIEAKREDKLHDDVPGRISRPGRTEG